MQTLSVKIAQVAFALHVESPSLHQALAQAWKDFVTDAPADIDLHLRSTALEPYVGVRVMPEVRVEKDGSYRIDTHSDWRAKISSDGTRAEVESGDERFPVETVVKLLLARRLLEQGGLLFHGVGLKSVNEGALFVAHSGEGKSTLGTWSTRAGLERLADELVAVIPGADCPTLHGTPWNVGLPLQAQLRILGTLAWSEEPRLESAKASQLAPKLLSNTLLFDASPVGRARVFLAAGELLDAVTCVTLYFAPDVSVGKTLREALASFT